MLTADDMIPMTVFVLIHARIANLHANLEYLAHFHTRSSELNIAHLNPLIANLQGAVEVIEHRQSSFRLRVAIGLALLL